MSEISEMLQGIHPPQQREDSQNLQQDWIQRLRVADARQSNAKWKTFHPMVKSAGCSYTCTNKESVKLSEVLLIYVVPYRVTKYIDSPRGVTPPLAVAFLANTPQLWHMSL
eukprot:3390404-Amphidinium_carterae.1